jgi:hypothetical protein
MWPCIKISLVYVIGNVKSWNVISVSSCSLWCGCVGVRLRQSVIRRTPTQWTGGDSKFNKKNCPTSIYFPVPVSFTSQITLLQIWSKTVRKAYIFLFLFLSPQQITLLKICPKLPDKHTFSCSCSLYLSNHSVPNLIKNCSTSIPFPVLLPLPLK